jgi:hypothetical protein
MELLNVSGFKPHELTQMFKFPPPGGGAPVPQQHIAPWHDRTALIYRIFEYLETGPLASGVTTGGRIPGKVNINALWYDSQDPTRPNRDPNKSPNVSAVFRALCDPGNPIVNPPIPSPNIFSLNDVDNIFDNLMASRTPNWATPNAPFGPTDKPFLPLSIGLSQGGAMGTPPDVQNPNGVSIENTLLRSDPTDANPVDTLRRRMFDVPAADQGTTPPTVPSPNPYLRKQLLTKIYNNLTTRSNVFAVWLTAGFFEVIDDTVLPVKLGAEIGRAENRQIRRRMFAIVDRSVLTNNPGPQQRFDARQNSPGTTGARVVPYFSIIQ